MTPDKRIAAMRRILVAMDASQGSLSALETATMLAELVHADLEGLYIEDADLIALTGLPFSREVRFTGGGVQALDLAALEQELRMQAMAARRAMQRVATQRRVTWRFRSVRGSVFGELAAAAREVDVLCIGRRGRSAVRSGRLGNTIRAALGSAPVVMVAGTTAAELLGPVAVVVGPGGITERALLFAAEVSERMGQPLQVYLTAGDSKAVDAQRRRIEEVSPERWPAQFHTFEPAQTPLLFETLRRSHQGLVVCGAAVEEAQFDWLERLVASVECPVLVFNNEMAGTDVTD